MQSQPIPQRYFDLMKQLDRIEFIINSTPPHFFNEDLHSFRMQRFEETFQEMKAIEREYYQNNHLQKAAA